MNEALRETGFIVTFLGSDNRVLAEKSGKYKPLRRPPAEAAARQLYALSQDWNATGLETLSSAVGQEFHHARVVFRNAGTERIVDVPRDEVLNTINKKNLTAKFRKGTSKRWRALHTLFF